MPKVPKSTRTLNKLVSSHIPPSQDSLCICIRDFTKMILGLTKNNNNLPLPPSSDEVDTATPLNITDVDIDSLVVEERNIATEEASNTKRILHKYKSLCLSEMAQHNIQHPTFQWDIKGQTSWDGLVIDILVKHWLYAKNKESFQEYPLKSGFCTKTIVSVIVEQWLRGQKASYGKDKNNNQNLSRIKKKAKKLLGCETASQIIPHMNCISDTEEDEDGNLPCIESN
ncbi:hypothetical protein PPACK8108_LOCUS12806 [Phakopsora pachyrhizi]|uniref:Uncharacterized protein n=1 Tax=Phakopsora pachyrhizi TaxID=170000 RepID=A0AAV0B4Q6_PHAPC|nr:hypothetical protein PPACK8108_LOCUS12806 [Phakopsora pachyrhizi]